MIYSEYSKILTIVETYKRDCSIDGFLYYEGIQEGLLLIFIAKWTSQISKIELLKCISLDK